MTTKRTAFEPVRRSTFREKVAFTLLAVVVGCGIWPQLASAQGFARSSGNRETADRTPDVIDEIGVDEHLGERIPLDLEFQHHSGRPAKLGDFFEGDRPVILTLNYSSCPMLCSLQLDGLVNALSEVSLVLGEDYRIVTVSIDPTEGPLDARKTMQKYMQKYGREDVTSGWDFLVGKDENIRALADAVGFRYQFVEESGEYAHTAVDMICTPDGRLSRYLYGVTLDPTTVRLSLVESSNGEIGTPMDQILLFCFRYDPESGSYAAFARNLMKVGGVGIVVVLAVFLFVMIRRERQVSRRLESAESHQVPAGIAGLDTTATSEMALEGGKTS